MMKNIVALAKKPNSNGTPSTFKLPKSVTTASIPRTTLIQQNPILHNSNRIVTVGLISSYGKEGGIRNFSSTMPKMMSPRDTFSTFEGIDMATMSEATSKNPVLTLYKKATKTLIGCAFSFKYSYQFKCVFIEAAPQKGVENKFEWEKKSQLKISMNELGKLLTILDGTEKRVELNHSMEREGKVSQSSFVVVKNEQDNTHTITVTRAVEDVKNSNTIIIDQSDLVLVTEFLRCSIRSGLGFF